MREEVCPYCLKCEDGWSAESDVSCHDTCRLYQKWKEGN